jgi:hypothetical protein
MLTAIFSLPLYFLMMLIFALLLAGEYLGRTIWRRSKAQPRETGDHNNVVASVYALLGLLIAFTFGMAVERYEARRDLVVKEANAIGTAHIRAALAAEPYQAKLKDLLENYAELRLSFGKASTSARYPIIERSAGMRNEIARTVILASKSAPSAPMGASLLSSVNEVIDVGGEREAMALAFIPETVAWLLIAYAFAAALLLGYSGKSEQRHISFANAILLSLLTLALTLIADLDRPSGGTITITQYPLEQLVKEFR